jgi:hypothetical protein
MAKLVAPFVLRDFHKVLDADYDRYEDFLRAILLNRIDFVKKHTRILKIMVHEIPFHPDLQAQFKEHVASKVVDRVRRIVTHFQERGQIVDMPPYTVMRLSGTAMIGYVVARYFLLPDMEWDDAQEIELTIQFIMRGLTRTPDLEEDEV